MKIVLSLFLLISLVGCGNVNSIHTPDHKKQIDSNGLRITLLEAKDAVQDLRLDSIDIMLANLTTRVETNEDDIDDNERDIAALFMEVADLDNDLSILRDDLNSAVASLRQADRVTRRIIRRRVRSLRRLLFREIRDRVQADMRLQSSINVVANDLDRFESRQMYLNRYAFFALRRVNVRITLLQQNIQTQLNNLDNRVTVNESSISNIQSDIIALQDQTTDLQTQINTVSSQVTSVVYPCGEGNSQEILLQTQDGLVAYFQQSSNKTINFSDSITIDAYTIPAHLEKFCVDTHFFNGECKEFDTRFVGEHTIPAQTYNVGDTASIRTINRAYLDVLGQGSYRTTDGFSCNFSVNANGELVQNNGGNR